MSQQSKPSHYLRLASEAKNPRDKAMWMREANAALDKQIAANRGEAGGST